MAKFKVVELKNTHHLMEAKRGVLMRTLMMAMNKYNPEKVVLQKGENIKMSIPAEHVEGGKFSNRVLPRSPVRVIDDKEVK